MIDCNKSLTQLNGPLLLRVAIALLLVISLTTYSNAQALSTFDSSVDDVISDTEENSLKDDFSKFKRIAEEAGDFVKDVFKNGKLAKKTGTKLDGRAIFEEVTGGPALPHPDEIATLWDNNSDLDAKPLQSIGLNADPSASYGLFGFVAGKYNENGELCEEGEEGKPLVLKISGKFPAAAYMSFQIYRGKPLQGSKGVGKTLSGYEIIPRENHKNPFANERPSPFTRPNEGLDDHDYEIFLVPVNDLEAAEEQGTPPNTIYYEVSDDKYKESDGTAVITSFYRVYLPLGEKIEKTDLPKIEGFLSDPRDPRDDNVFSHENPNIDFDNPVRPKFAKLVKSWYADIPIGNILFNVSQFWKKKDSLRWFDVGKFFELAKTVAGQGASDDLSYEMCVKQVAVGEYVVIRFKAPELYFGGNPEDPNLFPPGVKKVRYWSLCTYYYPRLEGLNSLPCNPNQEGARTVTVVFGKHRPGVEEKVRELGAKFLPDTREESQRVVFFMLRNILPTNKDELANPERQIQLEEAKLILEEAIAKLQKVPELFPELELKDKVEKLKAELQTIEEGIRAVFEEPWMFNGEYSPKGEVFSLHEFLSLAPEENEDLDEFLDRVIGDEK